MRFSRVRSLLTPSLLGLTLGTSLLATAACGGGGDGDDDTVTPDARGSLFPEVPPCNDTPMPAFAGSPRVIMSHLEIGDLEDGFDLDGDGNPDNKLAGARALAGGAIDDAFGDYSLMIPFEFYDMPAVATDDCVKFAIYLGKYAQDNDGDDQDTAKEGGDCDDTEATIFHGATEIDGNGKDDDCDGLADDVGDVASADTSDADGDGVTIAAGDCDDSVATGATVGGVAEICGDGRDNDCDGVADRGLLGDGSIACNPYDAVDPEPMPIDPLSFDEAGDSLIRFEAGSLTSGGDGVMLEAGPSLFGVTLPIQDGLNLELKITGTTILGTMVEDAAGVHIMDGRIGGIIDVKTADDVRGLDVEAIGLTPENSLLDAIFANLLGAVLVLPVVPEGTVPYEDCRMPDIDVDGDGREAFCDSNLDDDNKAVDICIDGDGTVIMDTPDLECTKALDANGKPRFVDGISVELNFTGEPGGEYSLAETP